MKYFELRDLLLLVILFAFLELYDIFLVECDLLAVLVLDLDINYLRILHHCLIENIFAG